MRLTLSAFALLMLAGPAALAGPLPWNYTVRFAPSGNAGAILLGTDTRYEYDHLTGVETATPVSIILKDSERFASGQAYFGTIDLFMFHHGMWNLTEGMWNSTESPPSNTISNQFVLEYDFTDAGPHGSLGGTISADGVFSTGTGNFTLGLTDQPGLYLEGIDARLQFGVRESESQSVITMTITPEPAPTPEPATLALAGIGLAGLLGYRVRRRITA